MIKGRIKKTDTYTIEIKTMFRPKKRRFRYAENYTVETFYFLPLDMGINKRNYTNIDFYRELKSYIKIDPPKVLLAEIANAEGDFMVKLEKAFQHQNANDVTSAEVLSDYILVFMNILKKAIKREIRKIEYSNELSEKKRITHRLRKNMEIAVREFRAKIGDISLVENDFLRKTFHYSDEYASNLRYRYTQHLIYLFSKYENEAGELLEKLREDLRQEINYRQEKNYPIVSENNKQNAKMLRRWDVVKYFVTNKLILNPRVDKEVRYILEILYSIAAGIAMIFATAVAFYYGKKFGNFTYGLFVVLVISYMFKDRIKEWGRSFFNNILKKQMLDHRFNLYNNNQKKLGVAHTGFSFIPMRNIRGEILEIRHQGDDTDVKVGEKVMKFTRKVKINSKRLKSTFKEMNIRGINDVLRFNFLPLTLRLEDPEIPIYLHNEDLEVVRKMASKSVPVHIVLAIQHGEQKFYEHYLLRINRNGIQKLKQIELIK